MRTGSGSRNLLGFVAIAVVAFGVTLYLVPGSSGGTGSSSTQPGAAPQDPSSEYEVPATPDVTPSIGAAPATEPPAGSPAPRMRGYVLPLAELRGISTATPAGSVVEIWVTWRRDVGGGSQVQRVVDRAVIGAVREPTVPEGPDTVEIFIPVDEFPDFLAAHEFGSLNAAIIP